MARFRRFYIRNLAHKETARKGSRVPLVQAEEAELKVLCHKIDRVEESQENSRGIGKHLVNESPV